VGAVASAVWAYFSLRPLVEAVAAGAGAMATVDGSAHEFLQYFIPPFIAFWLASRVRGRGRLARRLRRVHLFTTVAWIVLVGCLSMIILSSNSSGLNGLWIMAMFGTLLGGALWLPVQAFFSAAFLAVLIKGKRRSTRPTLETSVTH
jgi:hypothetical protein